MLVKIINSPPTIYMSAIVGTKLEAALPMLLIPPNITNATNMAITDPIIILDTPNSIESTCATELDCTLLPIPNAAIIPKNANK